MASPSTRQYFQFQQQILGSLKARSESNELRLRNEINMVRTMCGGPLIWARTDHHQAFNLVSQNQNQTTALINRAARHDAQTVRAISIVTLIFLPATFVSVCGSVIISSSIIRALTVHQTLFSMTFFNFSPGTDTQKESWNVSNHLWVYFSVAVPFTVLTMAAWLWWQHSLHRGYTI